MTDIENAHNLLPNIPDDIFDIWLNPIIKKHGFPFRTINDDIRDTIWFGYFGHCSLKFFSAHTWAKLTNISVDEIPFKESSSYIIDRLISYNLTGEWTLGGRPIPDCKERFNSHVSIVQRTGRLVAPIIVRITIDGFLVLDGSHRIAAVRHIRQLNSEQFKSGPKPFPIDLWIGNHT